MGDTNKFKKRVILVAIMIGICSFGVSYSAWADTDMATQTDDFMIHLNTNNVAEELEATIINTGNVINISGMESFEMSDLLSGEASIIIDYRLEDVDLKNDLQQFVKGNYDLGMIPFKLSMEEPYPFWKVFNNNGSWGIGVPNIGIPSVIYKLLPVSLLELHGYNNITFNKGGVVRGTITIKQIISHTYIVPEIKLSELGFSKAINQKVNANEVESSRMEIMANYSFNVPFLCSNSLQVQGDATLRMYVNVIHDITSSGVAKEKN